MSHNGLPDREPFDFSAVFDTNLLDRLTRYAEHQIGTSEPDDVVQEAIAKVLSVPRYLDDPANYYAYLCTAVHNTAIDRSRRKKLPTTQLFDDSIVSRYRGPDAESELEYQSLLAEITRRLTLIEISVLSYALAGLSRKEIAKEIDRSPRMVQKYLESIRSKLPKDLA